jgi:hypothetical protein
VLPQLSSTCIPVAARNSWKVLLAGKVSLTGSRSLEALCLDSCHRPAHDNPSVRGAATTSNASRNLVALRAIIPGISQPCDNLSVTGVAIASSNSSENLATLGIIIPGDVSYCDYYVLLAGRSCSPKVLVLQAEWYMSKATERPS